MSTDAARCPQCGGSMTPGTTSFCFGARSDEGVALIENIPALVCDQCGHATYTLSVAEEIDRLLDQRPPPTGSVTIPVYKLIEGRYRWPIRAASDRG
jgi:YgiT-type zinc finger domain-containing protein